MGIWPFYRRLGQLSLQTLPVWRYRGRSTSRNRGRFLHRLIIGPAAPLGRNPGNITVRVLHVAGFAVDTILGIDLEARTCCLLDPFINAGRAIAVRRAGIDIVL